MTQEIDYDQLCKNVLARFPKTLAALAESERAEVDYMGNVEGDTPLERFASAMDLAHNGMTTNVVIQIKDAEALLEELLIYNIRKRTQCDTL